MKIIEDSYWLKPFGAHINCINSIYGECPQNIGTLEECMDICEKDPRCNAGYFVEDKQTRTKFCVPLYTVTWQNTNLYDNLIDSRNPTRLSSAKGLKSTVFVNEKRFPETLPPDYPNYIFVGDKVFLRIYQDNKSFYMTENFLISPFQKDAVDITFGLLSIKGWMGEQARIGRGSNFVLNLKDTFLTMLITLPRYNSFFWSPVKQENVVGFNFVNDTPEETYQFINSGDRFRFYKMEGSVPYFITIKNETLTTTVHLKEAGIFSFQKIADDPHNQFRNLPHRDPQKSKGLLYDTMNEFIERYSDTGPIPKTTTRWGQIINGVLIGLIFFLGIFSITITILLTRVKY